MGQPRCINDQPGLLPGEYPEDIPASVRDFCAHYDVGIRDYIGDPIPLIVLSPATWRKVVDVAAWQHDVYSMRVEIGDIGVNMKAGISFGENGTAVVIQSSMPIRPGVVVEWGE